MTDHEDVQHRQTFEARPGDAEVRQPEGEDGLFRVRLPVTSTAEARDGKAFDGSKVEGFREQIERGDIGVFLDHGRNYDIAESRYSALGKIGYWDDPEVREREGETELWPEAVIADPDVMDDDVGEIQSILAWLKRQAELGIPIATSVGWSDETGDRDLPGDSDLLEISIVGIPSDPATTTTAQASAEPATTLARAVSAASSDFDIERFVRELKRQAEDVDTVQVPSYDEAANPDDISWDGHDLEDFEDVIDDPSPQDATVYEKFAYSETGFPPAEDAEFDSLGYPLVTVDGTLLWQALTDADEVHPAGLEGDEEAAMASVLIELSESAFPDKSLPELEGDTNENSMSDDTDEFGEQPDDTNADESDGMDAQEYRESMLEMQRNQTETLETLAEAVRQDGEDEEDGDEGGDGDDDEEDDDMEEESADAADERMVTLDGEEMRAREAVGNLREQLDDDPEPEDPETQDRGESDEDESDDDQSNDFWS